MTIVAVCINHEVSHPLPRYSKRLQPLTLMRQVQLWKLDDEEMKEFFHELIGKNYYKSINLCIFYFSVGEVQHILIDL